VHKLKNHKHHTKNHKPHTSLLMQDLVTHQKHLGVQVTDESNLLERSLNRSGRRHTGLTGIAEWSDKSSSGSDEKTFKRLPERDPVRVNVCWLVLASADQLGRPRIIIEMKEE
jgi:hypothetical protein